MIPGIYAALRSYPDHSSKLKWELEQMAASLKYQEKLRMMSEDRRYVMRSLLGEGGHLNGLA